MSCRVQDKQEVGSDEGHPRRSSRRRQVTEQIQLRDLCAGRQQRLLGGDTLAQVRNRLRHVDIQGTAFRLRQLRLFLRKKRLGIVQPVHGVSVKGLLGAHIVQGILDFSGGAGDIAVIGQRGVQILEGLENVGSGVAEQLAPGQVDGHGLTLGDFHAVGIRVSIVGHAGSSRGVRDVRLGGGGRA